MKKPIISNRVFWACVVLASAGLIGRNIGQAAPPVKTEITARTLTLVDDSGHEVITMGAGDNNTAILTIGTNGKSGRIKIAAEPTHGATITFDDKDKPTRLITAYARKDMSLSGPPH